MTGRQTYAVAPRLAGHSKFHFGKLLSLALDGWFAFSSSPLKLSLLMTFGAMLLGVGYGIYSLVVYLQDKVVPGWTSIIAFLGLFFSAVFAVLSIMAEYVSRIYEDVRRHPVYRVRPDGTDAPGPGKGSDAP